MAKKSTAARHNNAARRPQTTAKTAGVTLVRTPKETGPEKAGAGTAVERSPETQAASAGTQEKKPQTASSAIAPRSRAPEAPKAAAKPAPKPESAQSKPQPNRVQAARVARARATQRARIANMITPEHYSYVLNDLRLIASLAAAMFVVIIVLHFVLG